VRRDDLALPLIEMRRASAGERALAVRADAGERVERRRTPRSWHTLPGRGVDHRSRG
jgi:hypothetical protein